MVEPEASHGGRWGASSVAVVDGTRLCDRLCQCEIHIVVTERGPGSSLVQNIAVVGGSRGMPRVRVVTVTGTGIERMLVGN